MKKILVTGSAGLIGSEVCMFFANKDFYVYGVDNNQRKEFFGEQGDTNWNLQRLKKEVEAYTHYNIDIRNREEIDKLISDLKPNVIVHTAAQPSHDKAASIPFVDFEVNALGTLNLLEAVRRHNRDTVFIHMSTNKVYGDAPNSIPLKELDTRWEYDDPQYSKGIPETFTIDQSTHSLFGASKLAGDILVQEYGRYFDIPTCCLRGGCLTGPNHSGVELHGFLSYLVKCNLEEMDYKIYGYKGKQVRDNIHSFDVAQFMYLFSQQPRIAEVYNLGGGKENSCSILEAFKITEKLTGKAQRWLYVDQNRIGDHICYYSDLTKMRDHYPTWGVTKNLESLINEIVVAWQARIGH